MSLRRRGFTVLEVTLAVSVFAVIAFVLTDVLTSENKNAAALVDDLTVNNEARSILQQVSRDVRSASEVVLEPAQINPPANSLGIDETKGKITLRYAAPTVETGSADLRRFQVRYALVGKNDPAPAGLPQARVKTYTFLDGGKKWLFPLVRETALLDRGSTTPRVRDQTLVGWVRELAFYQVQPAGFDVTSLPTVYVKLVMSAFKMQGPNGAQVEAYREEFSTGVTARSIVSSLAPRLQ